MKKALPKYSIGVDYGTNSVRALVVRLSDGRECGTCVFPYPSGTDGILLDPADPQLARQSPSDYVDGFFASVKGAVDAAKKADPDFAPERVVGLGVDTTGSTPIPVDAKGVPLAFKPQFRKNLNAQAWLWKDHTAHEEAAKITAAAKKARVPYLDWCGGTYSSEWFWAKVWHCMKADPKVFAAAHSWVELCDFVPAFATGVLDPAKMRRSVCAAGHKALFSAKWGGLPSKKFLSALSPKLAALRDRLYEQAVPSDWPAGTLAPSVAEKVGLTPATVVAVGAFDCHHGAVGCGVGPGTLVKILGTSTCDIMVAGKADRTIPGVCGIVEGSVLPGMFGIEAGQSAVGDIFKWYVDRNLPGAFAGPNPYAALEKEAAKLAPGASGLLALDWNNGNRTILVDTMLTGALAGLTLYTTPAEIYRALVEGTAFGARAIVERVEEYGTKVERVVTSGGLAEKMPMLMQIYADVLGRPIRISRSAQSCALGAAVFGAVAAGEFGGDVAAAQKAVTAVKPLVYKPNPAAVRVYDRLYRLYKQLHDAFGTPAGAEFNVMKDLIAIRSAARKAGPARKKRAVRAKRGGGA